MVFTFPYIIVCSSPDDRSVLSGDRFSGLSYIERMRIKFPGKNPGALLLSCSICNITLQTKGVNTCDMEKNILDYNKRYDSYSYQLKI